MALTYNKQDDEIVFCREFSLDAEAHIAMAALEQAGIISIIDNNIFASIYPMPYGSPMGGSRLMVKKRDLDKALIIIDSLNFEGA